VRISTFLVFGYALALGTKERERRLTPKRSSPVECAIENKAGIQTKFEFQYEIFPTRGDGSGDVDVGSGRTALKNAATSEVKPATSDSKKNYIYRGTSNNKPLLMDENMCVRKLLSKTKIK